MCDSFTHRPSLSSLSLWQPLKPQALVVSQVHSPVPSKVSIKKRIVEGGWDVRRGERGGGGVGVERGRGREVEKEMGSVKE